MVKIEVITFFLLISLNVFAQKEINYSDILLKINNSQKSLCTTLIIPNKEFSIGIFTNKWEVEDLTEEQCGDIKTDFNNNSKLIREFNRFNLLDKLYLEMENGEYLSINTEDKFITSEQILILELLVYNLDEFTKIYIPIDDKKTAKRLIKSLSNIYDNKYCFRKLNRNL